ncbi:MAG: calcium-translocating P-type ATPase, SERCA-type [Endomicrobiales bacterium]
MTAKQWWRLETGEIEKVLQASAVSGLTRAAAREILQSAGPNLLRQKVKHTPLRIFLSQFDDFIIWVLFGAALISGALREWVDAFAIVAIILLNAVLGFIQEYRAEKALAALKKLSAPASLVIRDGQPITVPSAEIVPGDLVELDAGDLVPADSRLVSVTTNFATLESSLTGEATPIQKTTVPLEEKNDVPLADRANMVYMGTSVATGKARALVVATGMQTELGRIAGMIGEIEHETTPLQRKLEDFGRWIIYLSLALVGIIFALGLLRGGNLLELFLASVSLAVAAIPEGLPAVVTLVLGLGVQRMVKRHALIRKLPSVEALGAATVICSDKTGTLTKNEMTVRALFAGEALFAVTGTGYAPRGEILRDGKPVRLDDVPALKKTLLCGMLCNGARLAWQEGKFTIAGDPTEGALLVLGAKAGLVREALEKEYPFVEEIPFDSERKKMTVIRSHDGKYIAFVKGAPDILLENCTHIEEKGGVRAMREADREKILDANREMGNQALRVLAAAYRRFDRLPENYGHRDIEKELIFSGLIAMIDPPREEAKKAIGLCASSGIRTVMITGDHKNTAIAVARELGIFREGSRALTGEEVDALSDEALFREVKAAAVYARVNPEHKFRIVRALRRHREVVAMTGDGVNDAPAVKEADIGVAMGITGTDVTKEVADMVVTDDNFASIVAAVEEGRVIYDNIRKFIHYLLSGNAGEVLVMFVALLAGLPIPLLPIHILWINLITDGLPALALGIDPPARDIMRRPPRRTDEPVVTRPRAFLLLAQGSFLALCSLFAFVFVLFFEDGGIGRARTAAFMVLACSQLFHAFNIRSMTQSIFSIGFFTNPKLVLAVLASFALQICVVYVPFLQVLLSTEPLGLRDMAMIVAVSSFPLWAMEAVKWVNRKYPFLEDAW